MACSFFRARFYFFKLLVPQLLLRTDAIPNRPYFIYKRLIDMYGNTYCMKSHPVRFVLPQFCPKKAMSQSLCFDIEYSRSYRPLKSKTSQWSKIQNIYCNFFQFSIIIFLLDGFQPHHPLFIPDIHMLISIN